MPQPTEEGIAMLYEIDEDGNARPAAKEAVFREAALFSRMRKGKLIDNSSRARWEIWDRLHHEKEQEVFACLFLDTQNKVLEFTEICRGTIDRNNVYLREVARHAFRLNATRVILAHNHPSGATTASNEDIRLTNEFSHNLDAIGIGVLDHIIVGDEPVSMRDAGLFK
jgi:DNA repair protein RadC